jgi:hypothetical protein
MIVVLVTERVHARVNPRGLDGRGVDTRCPFNLAERTRSHTCTPGGVARVAGRCGARSPSSPSSPEWLVARRRNKQWALRRSGGGT